MYNLNPTTNQENQKQHEGVFTRARAHAPISAPIHAHTREGAKSRSRISLLPLLVAFAVTMIVGVGNVWGQRTLLFTRNSNNDVVKATKGTNTVSNADGAFTNKGSGAAEWTPPTGVKIMKVHGVGGGGGGGGAKVVAPAYSRRAAAGSGGGGGAYDYKLVSAENAIYTLSVGSGGSRGNKSGGNGTSGGSSYFKLKTADANTRLMDADGGTGGNGEAATSSNQGYRSWEGVLTGWKTYYNYQILPESSNAVDGGSYHNAGYNGGSGTTGSSENNPKATGGAGGAAGGYGVISMPSGYSLGGSKSGSASTGDYKIDGSTGNNYGGGGSGGSATEQNAVSYGDDTKEAYGGAGANGIVWVEYINMSVSCSQNVTCPGGNDGRITITMTAYKNATDSYTYSYVNTTTGEEQHDIPFSGTSTIIPGLTKGHYVVTVTFNGELECEREIEVKELAKLVTQITPTNVTCFDSLNGSAVVAITSEWNEVSFTPSASDVTYQWYNSNGSISGATSATLSDRPAGTYRVGVTVKVQDDPATYCTVYDTVDITQPTPINAFVLPAQVSVCEGDSVLLSATASGGGESKYKFTWKQGTGQNKVQVAADTNQYMVHTSNATGALVYTLVVEGKTNHCPQNNDDSIATVTVNQRPVVSITILHDTICEGGNATLTASVSNFSSGIRYDWSNGTENNSSITVSEAGPYTVTATVTATGCSNTADTTVVVHTSPADVVLNCPGTLLYNSDNNVISVRPLIENEETVTWEIISSTNSLTSNTDISQPRTDNTINVKAAALGEAVVKATITKIHNIEGCNEVTQSCTLNVAKNVMTVECPQTVAAVTYDGQEHAVLKSTDVIQVKDENGDPLSGASLYFKIDDTQFLTTTDTPKVVSAGNYQLTVKACHPSYSDNTCQYTMTVNRRPVTVQVMDCASWKGTRDTTEIAGHYTIKDGSLVEGHGVIGQIISGSAAGGVYYYSDTTMVNTASKSDVKVMSGTTDMTANYDITLHAEQTIMELQLVSKKDLTCNGVNKGEIVVAVTPDSTSYKYFINNEQTSITSHTFKNLAAGSYFIVVKNSAGTCTTNTLTGVKVEDIYPIALVSHDDTICKGGNASISVSATGGSGNYVYQWKDADDNVVGGNQAIVNVSPNNDATYTVTVSDLADNTCNKSATSDVKVFKPAVTLNNIASPTICSEQEVTLTAVVATGSVGTPTYEWKIGNDPVENGNQASVTVAPTNSTTYTVVATATVAEGTHSCSTTDSKNVTVKVNTPPSPTNLNVPSIIAMNDSAVVSVRPLVNGEKVTWTITGVTENETTGAATILTSDVASGVPCDTNSIKLRGDVIGKVKVEATIRQPNSYNDCNSTSVEGFIEVRPSAMNVVCPKDSTIVYSGASFDGDVTNSSIMVTAVVNGETVELAESTDYSLTYSYTDLEGTDHVDETVAPSITNAGTMQVTVTATHNSGSYEPNTCQYALTINKRPVTVEVVDCASWTGYPMVTNITNAMVTTQYLDSTLVAGDQISGTVTTVSADGGVYTYSEQTNINTAVKSSLVIKNSNNDAVTDNYDIKVKSEQTIMELQLVSVKNISCYDHANEGEIVVAVTPDSTSYKYFINNGEVSNITNHTFNNLSAGFYSVVVKNSAGTCTTNTLTGVEVKGIELIVLTTQNDTICEGGNTSIAVSATGGSGNFLYQWVEGESTPVTDGNQAIVNVAPTENTTYKVTVSDLADNTCQKNATCTVKVFKPAVVLKAMNAQTICSGSSVNLKAETDSYVGDVTYLWDTPEQDATASITKSPTTTTTYTVVATATVAEGMHSCTATDSKSVTVTVNTLPSPTNLNAPSIIAMNDSAVVNVRPLVNGEKVTWWISGVTEGETTGAVTISPSGVTSGIACTTNEIKLYGETIGKVRVAATIRQPNNLTYCDSIFVEDTIEVRPSAMKVVCPEPGTVVYSGNAYDGNVTASSFAVSAVVNGNNVTLENTDYKLTYSYTDLEGTDHVDETTAPSITDAGSVQVTVTATHNSGSYDPNTCQYTLQVNRRPVTVEVVDCSAWTGLRDTTHIVMGTNAQYAQGSLELVGGHVLSGMVITSSAAGDVYTYSDDEDVNTASKSVVTVMSGNTDMTDNYDIKVNSKQTIMEMQVVSVKGVTCHGTNNGEITVTALPANDTYIYYADGNLREDVHIVSTGVTYDNLAAGAHSVYAKSADGTCQTNTVTNVTVADIEPLAVTPVDTSIDVCAGGAVVLKAMATGGSMVYSYTWTAGNDTVGTEAMVLDVVAPNTTVYLLTVRDHNDYECSTTAKCTVNVRPGFPTNITAETNRVCMNNTLTLTETLNADDEHSVYQWTLGDGENGAVVGSATNSEVEVHWSSEGLKHVTVTVTNDSTGCTSTSTYEVTVDTLPIVTITAVDNRWSICPSQDSTILVAPAGEGLHYSWNVAGNSDTNRIKVGVAGNYTVTVTDGNGCWSSEMATVGQYPLPEVKLNGGNLTLNICPGQQTATLTASPVEDFTYIWMRGNDTVNNGTPLVTEYQNITTAGTYRVKVIDSVGCYAYSNYLTLSYYPIPEVKVNNPTICESGVAMLTANGAETYTWSPTTYLSNVDNAYAEFSGAVAGTYTDTVRGVNGHGCWDTAVAHITVRPDVVFLVNNPELLNQSVCAGTSLDSIKFHVENGTLSIVGGLPLYVVFHGDTVLGDYNGDIDGLTYQTGTFPFTVKAISNQTDPVCPTKEMSGVIKVNPIPAITLTPATQEVCAGGVIDTILITCAYGTLPETLDNINGLTYNRISADTAKLYGSVANSSLEIPVTVTSNQTEPVCAPVTENITITVHPNPVVKIAHIDDVCPAAGTQAVTANITTPTTANYTYYWTGGVWIDPMTTVTDSLANKVLANVPPTVCDESFSLRVELMDAYGCRSVDSTMMVVRDTTAPVITVLNNPMMARPIGNCKYEIPNLRDSVTVADNCNTGEFIFGQDVAAGSLMADAEQTKTVKVWVTGRCGHTDTAEVVIQKPAPVEVHITAADSVCYGSGTPLVASATSGYPGQIIYTWSPNTGLSATNVAEVVASPLTNTTYTVTARDGNGCFAQDSTKLYVYPLPVVTITDVPVLCPNAGQTMVYAQVDVNGGRGTSFDYHWTCEALNFNATHTNGVNNEQEVTNIPNTCNGEYTLNLEVTENGLGCKSTASTVITVRDDVNPTITSDFTSAWAVAQTGSNNTNGCTYVVPNLKDSTYTVTDFCTPLYAQAHIEQSIPAGTVIDAATPVTVTTTDSCGNTASTVVWVNVPNSFELTENTYAHQNVKCFGGSDGQVVVNNPDGGVAPYTYFVDGASNATSTEFTGLKAGEHIITAVAANGCVATLTVTITQPDTFKMTLTTVPATCANNDGTVTILVEGGTPNSSGKFGFDYTGTLQYTSSDTIFDQYSSSPAIAQNLPVGQYTVTIEDKMGCTITETFEIELNNNLVIDEIPTPAPRCSGGSFATIPVTSTPGTTYYTWPLPEQSVTDGVSGTTAATLEDEQTTVNGHNLVNNTNEPVSLTYHVTAHNGVCTYTSDLVMTVTATVRPPVVISTMDTIVCPSALDGFQLTATISNVYFAERDTLIWNFNNEQTIVQYYDNPSTSFTQHAAVNISASECNKVYPFTVEYTDGTCASSEDGTVTVRIPNQFTMVLPENTDTIVSCINDVKEPHLVPSKWPSSIIDGCGQVIDTFVRVQYPFISSICNGDVPFVYTFADCSGNEITYTYTYHIVRSAMTLPANGAATVACESDALVVPASLGEKPDACGVSVAPVYAENTETDPNPLREVVDGSGTVTHKYNYTTCDGQVSSWYFVYTVVPDHFDPFDTVSVNLQCKSAMVDVADVPVPDTTICGTHIDFTLNSNYPQDAFNGECGTRTYRYDYRVNGTDYQWYYIEEVEPVDFVMPANQQRIVACYSEINIGNIQLPQVTNACGSVLQPVSMTPVVTPNASEWHKCTDTVRCIYTYEDCAGHSHEWVYTWVVKDTLPPVFISIPEVVPAHRVRENGNCAYAYPTLDDVPMVVENGCEMVDEMISIFWNHQSDEGFWEYIEQTDEIQHLPVVVTATACGISAADSFFVEVPARLRAQEDLSSHKNVTCFGGSNGEIRVLATGGTPVYTFTINEPAATQTQTGYFTGLPVPNNALRGTDAFGGIWYGHDTVTVTDAHGCNVEVEVTVASPVKVEWENCPDTVVLCADPGENYRTVIIGEDFVPPTPSTIANNLKTTHTSYMPQYHYPVGNNTIRYTATNRVCNESDVCLVVLSILPNSSVKDSADNAIQEVCPVGEIDPIVFTFADADSIVLTGSLPASMVTYNTTQVSAFRTETQVTISGSVEVTTPTVYDYTFTAYSQAVPGSGSPCSEVTYSGAITIHDTVAPVYTKPANAVVYVDAQCHVDTSFLVTGVPSNASDNCSGVMRMSYRDEAPVVDCGGAYHFNRVWRLTDKSGNVSLSDSVQLITVLDTIRPVIAAGYQTEYAATPNLNCNSNVPNVCADILAHASDNCNGELTAEQVPALGTEILEDTDVLVTVKDACGNSTSTTVRVTANGVLVVTIDSVDAGCYHDQNDGAVYFTIQGDAAEYNAVVNGQNLVLPVGENMIDNLPYGDSLAIVVMASMPYNALIMCQSIKYFDIQPIAETLTVTANSHEWEYDNAEHQDPTFTVKFGDNIITTNAASGSEVELPNHDKVKATVTGAITDAGMVTNVLSDVMVLRGTDNVSCKYNQVLNSGTLTVTPAEITVTITGHNLTVDFDGEEHHVAGYDVNISDEFYTTANFKFNGDSTLSLTNADTVYMNLASGQFQDQWPTPNNIGSVNFVVAADGYLIINKINATVNIAGHQTTVDYDGEEHQVNGYETTFSTPLYSRADFDFTGDSLLTRTDAGIDSMYLAADQFSNQNSNFDTVTFIIDQDGFLRVTPINVTVTVIGHNHTDDYDNTEHTVMGYDLEFSTPLYTAADLTFTGSDTAKRTFVGTTNMGLAQGQFANINPNFAEVTFNVTDGYQTITPINAVVTIVGANTTVPYDGNSHTAKGYVATATPTLYNVDTSFTFSGDSIATRTNGGTTTMGLAQGQFTNTNPNFAEVTFNVTDGYVTIIPIDVTVTFTGHHDVVNYDATEHTVSGYDVAFSNSLYTRADFSFTGDSALALTNAGTVYMHLAPGQFTNTNTTNFAQVNFVVADDGYLTVNPIEATVTITGQRDTAVYDGQLHSVSDYDVVFSTPLYTAADFEFNGTAAASRTHVVEGNDESGVSHMGLTQNMFTNLNTNNFSNVNFVVNDGCQCIKPLAATVTISGHRQYNLYDGQEHVVSGFDTAYSTNLYSAADFTFTPAANADLVNGVVSARRTDYDTTYMGLAANQFANNNTDFSPVTFAVTDGYQAILTREVTVTIVGHNNTADYDGNEHVIKGYDVTTNNVLYSAADFDYNGDSTATRTNAGTTNMGLAESQFSNHNQNFGPVHFVVTDGYQTINKIDVEVAVKGTRDTVDYDGDEHTVTGYDLEFSTPLYKAEYVYFGGDEADSTASRTDAGTELMGLADNMFGNLSVTNFNNVTFTVVSDGAITIKPIGATVNITGNHDSHEYDGEEHIITGYTASTVTPLYDVAQIAFDGHDTATRVIVDTTWMGLTSDMFTNMNPNFENVTFNITDGYMAITPITAVVTITGHYDTVAYDGAAHTVTGYEASANTPLYNLATSFTFSGDSTATRTELGHEDMGIEADQFTNTNPNFKNVTFEVEDGYLYVKKRDVTVEIAGHHNSSLFDGTEHSVSGYDVNISDALYLESYFTFNGTAEAARTAVGTTNMGLEANQFNNTNDNFNVTFDVTDGYQKIEPRNVVVTITGHQVTLGYNGETQQATGYDVEFSNSFYTTDDFSFTGDSTVSGTNVGTYEMVLNESEFHNISTNFDTVTFVVTNGSLTVNQVPATVTIKGAQNTAPYDGASHQVTGYTATAQPTFYNVDTSFTFNGTAEASRTNVVEGNDITGKTFMNLAETMFENTNPNFSEVTFVVEDGYQAISPINTTVTIMGAHSTNGYNGTEQTVSGYTATATSDLYDVDHDFTFTPAAGATMVNNVIAAKRTYIGTTNMGLAAGQFANTNTNFDTVTFNVTDGYQTVTPVNATVTIKGNQVTTAYDGEAHTATGYTATAVPTCYNVTNGFLFNGTATASRTNVVEGDDHSGKTMMNLAETMFVNTDTNFASVTFVIAEDGYQQIAPREVTVTVKGHVDTVFFDNTPKQVTGYDVTIGDPMYAASNYTYDGTEADSTVTATLVGTFYMTLDGKFSNHNDNFDVTFDVTNGHLTILSNDVVVTIRGNHDSLTYNGQAQTVTGYEVVSIDHPTYTAEDFKFVGLQADSTATRTYIGTDSMGLTPTMFTNINDHYSNVTFVIERDGYVTITPASVVVLAEGHNDTVNYDGASHTITGFELSTVSTLYDLAKCEFHGLESDSTATRTDAGTTYMGLAASQFVNTDTNFHVILMVIDGYQYVKKDTVWVTVTGAHNQAPIAYDAEEHTVTGYTMISSNTDYNPYAYVMFTGTATASRTDAGTTNMGLTAAMFSNSNVNYHVIFNVTDGWQEIDPLPVTVYIEGVTSAMVSCGDNCQSGILSTYTKTASSSLFDVDCIQRVGNYSAFVSGTGPGLYMQGLAADQFVNNCDNGNFVVTIQVTDGWLRVLNSTNEAVVKIKGNRDTVYYNGSTQNVNGYSAEIYPQSSTYSTSDFTFNGTATASRQYIGVDSMHLTASQFENTNTSFSTVYFNVNDGFIIVKPIDTMVVTVKGAVDTVEYDGTEHTVTDYTATANCSLFDASKVVFNGTSAASRTLAGTTGMGLVASQFSYNDTNFTNVIFNVTDGHQTVTKKDLAVTAPEGVEFRKDYDGTPLTVSYDQLHYEGLVGNDALTQGVITTESAAVGTYVCGAGQMWAYADNEEGVADASGFGEPSVTQNYKVHFNVTLRIDPVTELNCPEQLSIVLLEGTADTSLTDAQLGTINNELVAAGVATVKSNINTLNPLSVGTYTVTWTIYDIAGTAMTTCDQTVVVEYAPCQAVSYNGYTYPAKRIGHQCWLTENLRTVKDAEGNTIADYHAYKDNATNLQKFGYLYTWYSAVGVAENNNNASPATQIGANGQSYVQGICPDGWAVPTIADYQELYDTIVDVLLLKDAGDDYWYPGLGGVTPNSGFNSRAGGFYHSAMGRYEDILTGDHYWKADNVPGSSSAAMGNVNYFCDSSANNQAPKADRRSVRCVKKN